MVKTLLAAVAALAFYVLLPADSAAGIPPQAEVCTACHGVEAPSPYAAVPTIHGLPFAVIDNALYDFRATIRPCRKPECGGTGDCPRLDFCSIVAKLSDEDIEILARWFSDQPFRPVTQPWDPALARKGEALHQAKCDSCHSQGGAVSSEDAGILRGQPKAYLALAIEDFRRERRVAVAEMHVTLMDLSDDEVAALLEFYASPLD